MFEVRRVFLLLFVTLVSISAFGDEVGDFVKSDVEQIRINITSGEDSLLDMKLTKDGMIGRQGSGQFPAEKTAVVGQTNGEIFNALVESLSEDVFAYANVYDHPDKSGIPITYSVVFLGKKPKIRAFEFRVGSETQNVGKLLPYFDSFIMNAVNKTEEWYSESKEK